MSQLVHDRTKFVKYKRNVLQCPDCKNLQSKQGRSVTLALFFLENSLPWFIAPSSLYFSGLCCWTHLSATTGRKSFSKLGVIELIPPVRSLLQAWTVFVRGGEVQFMFSQTSRWLESTVHDQASLPPATCSGKENDLGNEHGPSTEFFYFLTFF